MNNRSIFSISFQAAALLNSQNGREALDSHHNPYLDLSSYVSNRVTTSDTCPNADLFELFMNWLCMMTYMHPAA